MIAPILLLLACGGSDLHRYDTSLLHLATGFTAKEACSCLFVVGQDEERCREILRVSPDLARFKVDLVDRSVRARALGGWTRSAHYVDARTGCVLDPP